MCRNYIHNKTDLCVYCCEHMAQMSSNTYTHWIYHSLNRGIKIYINRQVIEHDNIRADRAVDERARSIEKETGESRRTF